jgi:hypothetical protein
MSSNESLQRLNRMRLHMAEAASLRTMRRRNGWTHYPKGSRADEVLVLRCTADNKTPERAGS